MVKHIFVIGGFQLKILIWNDLLQYLGKQTGTQEERLRTSVKPKSCLSYAWDEITLPPHLTCVAAGGTSATYNLNVLGEGARLSYENFIYIAFTGTFVK